MSFGLQQNPNLAQHTSTNLVQNVYATINLSGKSVCNKNETTPKSIIPSPKNIEDKATEDEWFRWHYLRLRPGLLLPKSNKAIGHHAPSLTNWTSKSSQQHPTQSPTKKFNYDPSPYLQLHPQTCATFQTVMRR